MALGIWLLSAAISIIGAFCYVSFNQRAYYLDNFRWNLGQVSGDQARILLIFVMLAGFPQPSRS
jgi:hypothetical protein